MKIIPIILLLLLCGCTPTSEDYKNVIVKCKERKGQYFTIMLPQFFGPRLATGCLEPQHDS